jgi:hypothetical protein
LESGGGSPASKAMNRLLIIICVILVALILSSLSVYRLCLSKSDIQQRYDPRGQRIEKIAEQALARSPAAPLDAAISKSWH